MKKIKKMLYTEDGFTLIETTIVLLVIAMLTLLILPNVSGVTKNVDGSTNKAVIETVETQKMLYESNNPTEDSADLDELVRLNYITEEQLKVYREAKNDETQQE